MPQATGKPPQPVSDSEKPERLLAAVLRSRCTSTIHLDGLGRGTYVATIRVRGADHRIRADRRVYRTCRAA
jgi:hypothetical protein